RRLQRCDALRQTPIAGSNQGAHVKARDPACIQKCGTGGLVGGFLSRSWILCGLVVIAASGVRAAAGSETEAGHARSANGNSADTRSQDEKAQDEKSDTNKPSVLVEAKRWLFNRETRYQHSLPEINGATITVTKKTDVVKLDNQPTIIDNNQRELFDRLPGMVLAEQQNPTQLNVSYRGLGNPQESEYVLLMQDGIPLELDWIGYPTTYYLPVP